ncbi:MAG TPA: energy transducer TonB [Burkholderiales bacterium]|nr:energy transducer TonB [Burkholderiales bacterium]
MPKALPYRVHERSSRLAAVGAALLLHAGVIAFLLQFQPVRSVLLKTAPIMVNLIDLPAAVEKPKELPKPLPVKPKITQPVPPRPEPALLIAATTEASTPAAAPAPQPLAPSSPVASPELAAWPVIPPSFNAAYLQNPAPAYPPLSRRLGQQGKVVLRVLVNAGGTPDKVEVRSSSGFDRLDAAALDAVKHWRFVPARQGEKPVDAWVLVPITFTLES